MVSILRNYHSVFQSGHSILQSHQPWIRVPVLACLFFFVCSAWHWDSSSPTRDQTHATCIGSTELKPTGLPEKSQAHFFKLDIYLIATAKSLQSCPTLCDPIDGSPPGSPVPGILQARTLEWVAISFSNA